MLINKSKTIFKYFIYGLICFALTVCFAFLTNYIYKEFKITDVLLVEGILFSLLGVSSLLGDNPNSTFDKEYLNLITSNTKEFNKRKANLNSKLEPTVDSYSTAIIFVTGGVLSIIATFIF